MRSVLVFLTGLLVLTPFAAAAGAACVGKVQFVYVEQDMNVYFSVLPTGECGCNNVAQSGGRGFKATIGNKKEQYAALLTAHASNSGVQIWYDWADASGGDRCISWNVGLVR